MPRRQGSGVEGEGTRVKCYRAAPRRRMGGVPGFVSWAMTGDRDERSFN